MTANVFTDLKYDLKIKGVHKRAGFHNMIWCLLEKQASSKCAFHFQCNFDFMHNDQYRFWRSAAFPYKYVYPI